LKSKKISYELYEDKFKYLLGGKTVEEKKKYFKKRLEAIKHREKDLLSRIKHETHASKSRAKAITVAAAMLVVFLPILTFTTLELSGFATTATSSVIGAANISSYYAVSMSTDLTNDITFSSLIHNTNDNSASSNNYGSSASGYYLTLDADSNTATKTCIKGANFYGPERLGLGNLTWNSSTSSSSTVPATPGTAMTTSYVTSQTSISPGDKDYYRFWMDVPSGQTAGSYNTTVTFKATTGSC